jgi:hypothetical protein
MSVQHAKRNPQLSAFSGFAFDELLTCESANLKTRTGSCCGRIQHICC